MATRKRKQTRKQKGGQALSVKFAGRNANGTRRNQANMKRPPTVSFQGRGLFTLLMWDPDAPASSWLHWLLVNIPDGSLDLGDTLVSYAPPSPPSGEHRYYVSLYKQESRISPSVPNSRGNFNVEGFAAENRLTLLGQKMIRVAAGV